MASSENQGLHIALIILFILVLLLSVATFMFFQRGQELEKAYNAEKANALAKSASEDKMQGEFNKIMKIVGLEATGEGDLARIEQTYTEDMAKYGATLSDEKKSYHAALEELFNSLNAAETALTASKDEEKKLLAANKVFEESSKKQVAEAEAAKIAAQQELAAEKAKFMTAAQKNADEKADFITKLAAAEQTKNTEVEKYTKEVAELNRKIATLEGSVSEFRGRVAQFMPTPGSLPDGEIRLVNQRTRVVWINLGSADKLNRGTTFSVFAPDDLVGSPDAVKAKIEVTQILGDHLAEARILEDHPTDLIIPGDKVYTNLWTPGRPERVAIIGRIDLDGDPSSDESQQLANIVTLNGGTVDAQLANDGTVTGNLTVNTRYLIVGPPPSERARAAYDRLQAEAKALGIETIGLDRFLDNLGWKPAQQVVRFGRNSNIDQVPPEAPDGGMPRSNNGMMPDGNLFKKRLPPVGRTSTSPAYAPVTVGG